jgi:hypothetical protein
LTPPRRTKADTLFSANGTSGKPQKSKNPKKTRSSAPPSFQEQDNVPARKSTRKQKATDHDEVEVFPIVPTEKPEILLIELSSDRRMRLNRAQMLVLPATN